MFLTVDHAAGGYHRAALMLQCLYALRPVSAGGYERVATADDYRTIIEQYDWHDLRVLWDAIKARQTRGWEPGKAFEYLVIRAFQRDGAAVTWPFSVRLFGEEVEQIDGAVYWEGLSCLIESKDTSDNMTVAPIAKLRNQLLRRPAGTLGILFTSGGVTDAARSLAYFSLPQAILLWSGDELEHALHEERMGEFLIWKYRACVEFGMPDYDIRERGIP